MNEKIIVTFQSLFGFHSEETWDDKHSVCRSIHVESYSEDIKKQRYPDEIVIPMRKIRVKYTYPLTESVIFDYETKNELGFTRAELAKKVCEEYQKIYAHEIGVITDRAIDHKILPYEIWGSLNDKLALQEVTQIEGNMFGLKVRGGF